MTAINFLIPLKLFTLPDYFNFTLMRKFAAFTLLLLGFGPLSAQILDPVSVTHTVKPIGDGMVELQVTATMEEGWHIYAINPDETSFVVFTEFNIPKGEGYKLVGKVAEPKPIKAYDPNFEEELEYHENTVTFTQRIKLKNSSDMKIKGEFVFQTCNDKVCLVPEYVDLLFEVKAPTAVN